MNPFLVTQSNPDVHRLHPIQLMIQSNPIHELIQSMSNSEIELKTKHYPLANDSNSVNFDLSSVLQECLFPHILSALGQ